MLLEGSKMRTAKENDLSVVNASFHVSHWSVQPYGTGISRMKYVGMYTALQLTRE
ncbi:Ryanodine receptor 44F [Zootermopsis nevadensis]|uniref:Ryanodine receptor 44F n=1 Tax=Zootermopsis nevadensis TaxID=136037 RepID=A0A067QMB0_ZOONE|nr:Ryanodine receptor 44F [Zootermopsis nevadensis]